MRQGCSTAQQKRGQQQVSQQMAPERRSRSGIAQLRMAGDLEKASMRNGGGTANQDRSGKGKGNSIQKGKVSTSGKQYSAYSSHQQFRKYYEESIRNQDSSKETLHFCVSNSFIKNITFSNVRYVLLS